MKPSIPKGTRDFSPQEMVKRNYIFDTIRKVYQMHGYQPIETPAFENSETLMGKYGEEGDRLIFKILNSGNYLDGLPNDLPVAANPLAQLTKHISEKALRYDLTVPFARYVVQHRNEITFPFKRYQIQPVWRADRPQKGRYREFYQCDADVIGSDSLLNEMELIQIIDEVFTTLKIPVVIKINNRKILQGIAEVMGTPDRMIDVATVMDKWEKIGEDRVVEELRRLNFTENQIARFNMLFVEYIKSIRTSGFSFISKLKDILIDQGITSQTAIEGIKEITYLYNMLGKDILESPTMILTNYSDIQFDLSLARGLNYYTGTIIEVKLNDSKGFTEEFEMFKGSICGGGRYDDLTGIFGLPGVSGVGISFGADRIYNIIEALDEFPKQIAATTKVLFINFGENEAQYCLKVLKDLHASGISAELYPDAKKINKQFEYADKRGIPYVVIVGGNEINRGIVKLRNMKTKEEKEMTVSELTTFNFV